MSERKYWVSLQVQQNACLISLQTGIVSDYVVMDGIETLY